RTAAAGTRGSGAPRRGRRRGCGDALGLAARSRRTPRSRRASASDLEELALLVSEDGVDLVDVLLGEGVELLLRAGALVLADLSVLDGGVDLVLRLAAHVAHGDASVLGT